MFATLLTLVIFVALVAWAFSLYGAIEQKIARKELAGGKYSAVFIIANVCTIIFGILALRLADWAHESQEAQGHEFLLQTLPHDIAIAAFVAVVLNVTVEIFGRLRHKLSEVESRQQLDEFGRVTAEKFKNLAKEVAAEVGTEVFLTKISARLSAAIGASLRNYLVDSPVVREEFSVIVKLDRVKVGEGAKRKYVIQFTSTHNYSLRNVVGTPTKFMFRAYIGLLKYPELSRLESLHIDDENIGEAEIDKISNDMGTLYSKEITITPDRPTWIKMVYSQGFDICDKDLLIIRQPATSLDLTVTVPDNMCVDVLALHAGDMTKAEGHLNQHRWKLKEGLLPGNGALIKWRVK